MLAILAPTAASAQRSGDDDKVPLDLLRAPSAPGFVLLGIEPASVQRPGDVTDLAFSVLTATGDLSVLPENYALEIAPYWLVSGGELTYADYARSADVGSTLLQSLSLSIAATSTAATSPDDSSTSLSFGARFSLMRGDLQDAQGKLDAFYEKARLLNDGLIASIQRLVAEDDRLPMLRDSMEAAVSEQKKAEYRDRINRRRGEIQRKARDDFEEAQVQGIEELKRLASELPTRRIGFNLDLAGGVVIDFPGRVFDDGSLSRWGGWATASYEHRRMAALVVLRVLGNRLHTNPTAIDLGGRVVLDDFKRISVSAEALGRFFPGTDTRGDEWRAAVVVDYSVAKNRTLTLTFGRDFEGNRTGNLLAAVSFLLGFGSSRPF
jgi:hypothetical protein